MPGWLKGVIIAVILVVLLLVGVISAGYLWWARNRDSLRAGANQAIAEGRTFGGSNDNQGCLDEGFVRYKKQPGYFNALNYGQFIEACLQVSRPTLGFCDDVPVGKMKEMATWRDLQCRHYDIPNDQKCFDLLVPEVMFCGSRKRGETSQD